MIVAGDTLPPQIAALKTGQVDAQVTGAKAGDILEFDATHPDPDEERQLRFKVLVKAVRERVLPDADDEWAAENLVPPRILGHELAGTVIGDGTPGGLRPLHPFPVAAARGWAGPCQRHGAQRRGPPRDGASDPSHTGHAARRPQRLHASTVPSPRRATSTTAAPSAATAARTASSIEPARTVGVTPPSARSTSSGVSPIATTPTSRSAAAQNRPGERSERPRSLPAVDIATRQPAPGAPSMTTSSGIRYPRRPRIRVFFMNPS